MAVLEIVDATPPPDFPELVVIMDKEIAARHPDKVFWLRVAKPNGDIDAVHLDGAVTPLDARRLAREQGFEPTHWTEVGKGWLNRY